MKKQKFTYYMHSDCDDLEEFIREETDLELSDEAIQNICDSRPFYEVGIECEVDEKGNVTLLGIAKS